MAERIPARLTAAEGRRFGLTVGAAFCVIAALVWWRSHQTVATVLGGIGGLLVLAGLAIPAHLGPVERAWMGMAHVISKVTTPIVMGAMYLLVITPVGFLRTRLSRNPLVHVKAENSYWRSRPDGARRSKTMERQF